DLRQPPQARRERQEGAVAAVEGGQEAGGEERAEAGFHERLGVAVRADDVVPPLVRRLLGGQHLPKAGRERGPRGEPLLGSRHATWGGVKGRAASSSTYLHGLTPQPR